MSVFTDARIDPLDQPGEIITCVVCFDKGYAPHASAMLLSLAENALAADITEVVILFSDVDSDIRDKITDLVRPFPATVLRWVDMSGSFSGAYRSAHYSFVAYYRLAIPEVLCRHKKVVYLDVDMILKSDVADLFRVDLKGKPIGAAYNGSALFKLDTGANVPGFDLNSYQYWKQILGFSDEEIAFSFNSGMLVMDLEKIRSTNDLKQFEEELGKKYAYLDQCILNRVYRGDRHLILPQKWNVENLLSWERIVADEKKFQIYLDARKHPSLIHFLDKPWVAKIWRYEAPFAEIYWSYLKRTPWFSEIRQKFEADRKALGVQPPSFSSKIKTGIKSLPVIGSVLKKILAK